MNFVNADDTLEYTIYFENKPDAGLDAQRIRIETWLDPNLDWSTFRPVQFTFGSHSYNVPTSWDSPFFSYRALVAPYPFQVEQTNDFWVDMYVDLNFSSGKTVWYFFTYDAVTGQPTFRGLLPPNNNCNGCGEGHVTFTAKPRHGVPDGVLVWGQANIYFDFNPLVATNQWENHITYFYPGPMVPISPPDGASSQPAAIFFEWSESKWAVDYNLTLWQAGPTRPEANQFGGVTFAAFPVPYLLDYNTTYFWKVMAKNTSGTRESDTWSFMTGPEPAEPPTPFPTFPSSPTPADTATPTPPPWETPTPTVTPTPVPPMVPISGGKAGFLLLLAFSFTLLTTAIFLYRRIPG